MDVEVRSSSGELMKPNFTFDAEYDSSKFEYLLRADEGFSYTVKGRFLDKRLDVRMFKNLGNIKIKNNYFTCTIDKEFLKKHIRSAQVLVGQENILGLTSLDPKK